MTNFIPRDKICRYLRKHRKTKISLETKSFYFLGNCSKSEQFHRFDVSESRGRKENFATSLRKLYSDSYAFKKHRMEIARSMISELQSDNKVVGIRQSIKAVEQGRAKCAFVAKDSDDAVRVPFEALCLRSGVAIEYVDSMIQLGEACAIDVGCAVAVIMI